MSLTSAETGPIKPEITRASWGFLGVNIGITIAICYAGSVQPLQTLAISSVVLLTLLSLWRLELALAAFISGLGLVTHSWTSIGLQGFGQPLASAIILLGFAVHSIKYGFRLRWGPLPALVLSLALLMIIGLLYTPSPALGLRRTAEYLIVNLVVFGVALLNHDSRLLGRLLWGIVGFGLATAVLSIIDIAFFSGAQGGRYSIAETNAIWYSRGLGLAVILFLALTAELRRPALHAFKWLLLIALIYLMVIAASRGPLLAMVATVCIYLYWIPGKRFRPIRILPTMLFILFIVLLYFAVPRPEITSRLTMLSESYRDISTLYRIQAIFSSLELFLHKPLLGVGTAGFSAIGLLRYPHNIVLEFACEYGLVGIGLMVTTVVLVVSQCRTLLRRLASRPRELNILRGFILITLYALINAQVSGSITGNSWIWLGIGGIWAVSTIVSDRSHQQAAANTSSL